MFELFFIIFAFLALCAALFDFLFYRIPNFLLALMIVIYVPVAFFTQNPHDIKTAALLSLATLGVGFVLYLLKLMGPGDAKFLAVCVLWASFGNLPLFFIMMALAGGVLSMVYLVAPAWMLNARLKMRTFFQEKLSVTPLHDFYQRYVNLPFEDAGDGTLKGTQVPYGVAIFGAVFYMTLYMLRG